MPGSGEPHYSQPPAGVAFLASKSTVNSANGGARRRLGRREGTDFLAWEHPGSCFLGGGGVFLSYFLIKYLQVIYWMSGPAGVI